MRVLIQLRYSAEVHEAATAEVFPTAAATIGAALPGVEIDPAFSPVQLPSPLPVEPGEAFSLAQPRSFAITPEESTFLTRGSIPDDADGQRSALGAAFAHPSVVGVFSDPRIDTTLICPGDPPLGDDSDVAKLLGVDDLQQAGMDGNRVVVAVVDTGINRQYLESRGRTVRFSKARSWTPPGVMTAPGEHPTDHGTMCAYDVGIAAPNARLLDYALLLSQTPGETTMSGFLSDAVAGYAKLLQVIDQIPANRRALVVTNSWGMFRPSWDFPVGHPGNYSDNPAHPFNIIVASLESAGADILFAAGNCGRDCPDGRCGFTSRPICGANSHPAVLSVAGIDTEKQRVGYSSQGPGRLDPRKPDISAYTHFQGSRVYDADGGTSAACPVAAGVVAAVRSRYPTSRLSPSQLRALIFKTAEDLSGLGWDDDHGWGAINASALVDALEGVGPASTSSRRPPRKRRKPPRRAAKTASRRTRSRKAASA
jgi:subtilisin family serine protease